MGCNIVHMKKKSAHPFFLTSSYSLPIIKNGLHLKINKCIWHDLYLYRLTELNCIENLNEHKKIASICLCFILCQSLLVKITSKVHYISVNYWMDNRINSKKIYV